MANYQKLSVKPSTKKMLAQVKETFLFHNPQFRNVRITEDMLVKRCFEYYIEG